MHQSRKQQLLDAQAYVNALVDSDPTTFVAEVVDALTEYGMGTAEVTERLQAVVDAHNKLNTGDNTDA